MALTCVRSMQGLVELIFSTDMTRATSISLCIRLQIHRTSPCSINVADALFRGLVQIGDWGKQSPNQYKYRLASISRLQFPNPSVRVIGGVHKISLALGKRDAQNFRR